MVLIGIKTQRGVIIHNKINNVCLSLIIALDGNMAIQFWRSEIENSTIGKVIDERSRMRA